MMEQIKALEYIQYMFILDTRRGLMVLLSCR
jgi:hypothetical protein